MIAIELLDHGPGVPPEEQDKIFRSFHRVGDDETTVEGSNPSSPAIVMSRDIGDT
jgi:signal transduction histidine kinase